MTTPTPHDEYDILRNIVEQLKNLPKEDQELIIKWACERLNISEISKTSTLPAPAQQISQTPTTTVSPQITNIKTFVEEKKPQSDTHFAAVVAYFYRFLAVEKKDTISTEDLQEATRLSGRARLSNPAKTLNNAISSGLLDNSGRGLYKINTVGENLVAIVLPGDAKNNPTIRRKKTKPSTKNKK